MKLQAALSLFKRSTQHLQIFMLHLTGTQAPKQHSGSKLRRVSAQFCALVFFAIFHACQNAMCCRLVGSHSCKQNFFLCRFSLSLSLSLSLSEQASVAMKKIRSPVNLGTRTYTDLQYTYTYTHHLRIGIV
jgi:hypothetical protein